MLCYMVLQDLKVGESDVEGSDNSDVPASG